MLRMMIEIAEGTAADVAAVKTLLTRAHLPIDGFEPELAFLVARRNGVVVGSAAIEEFASGALLRSVVVVEELRGSGLGQRLTNAALELARGRGHHTVYLLTTTAGGFFPRFGFQAVDRGEVPPDVRQSIEFTSACPESAFVMRRHFQGSGLRAKSWKGQEGMRDT
jgi:amino-acid N-acetyltransferase